MKRTGRQAGRQAAGRRQASAHFAFCFSIYFVAVQPFVVPFAAVVAVVVVFLVAAAVVVNALSFGCFISKDFALVCIKISLCCLAL